MSMYNAVFGSNGAGPAILATLGLTTADVGRYRDCFVSDGKIAVYTRNGGGNREEYQETIDKLAKHPLYLSDSDDDFDCTYCTIWFSLPEECREELLKIDSGEFNPSQRWLDAIEAIKTA